MRDRPATRTTRSATGVRNGGRRPTLLTVAALVLLSAVGLAAPAASEDTPADADAERAAPAEVPAENGQARASDAEAERAKSSLGDDAPAPPRTKAGDEIDDTRKALEKWVETRRLIAEEKRDWALGREMLNERIKIVQHEIESLREKIRNAEESIGEADKKRADLAEENAKLQAASAELKDTVIALEGRTKELLRRLPESTQTDIRQLSQQFPEDPQESKLSLGIRFQNVVGVLNHLNKRNRDITVASEVRDLPGGTSAEVTTLYVGIGQAYYVSADATLAGVGTATDNGWVWAPVNEIAPQVAQAIAILKNEKVASFVRLPLEVH